MKAKHFLALTGCFLAFLSCNNPKNSTASSDSTTVITEAAPATPLITITDKKWKLLELMGQPVADSINGKEPYIIFKKADSTYEASGGCNGLGGGFALDEKTLHIHFKQGMSTMMACPDMTVENGLKTVFADTDNYTANDSTLSLNKARMAPLARFRAVQ